MTLLTPETMAQLTAGSLQHYFAQAPVLPQPAALMQTAGAK